MGVEGARVGVGSYGVHTCLEFESRGGFPGNSKKSEQELVVFQNTKSSGKMTKKAEKNTGKGVRINVKKNQPY